MCSALPTGDITNPASSGGAIDKGGCRRFFEIDPRILVRGGEVWIDYEYLATNNKYDTREDSET